MALDELFGGLGSAGSGALMGAPLGPWGMAAGALVGAAKHFIGMGDRKKEKKANKRAAKHELSARRFALDEALRGQQGVGDQLEDTQRRLEESYGARGISDSSLARQGGERFGKYAQRSRDSAAGRVGLAQSALKIVEDNYRRLRKGKNWSAVGNALGNLFGAGAGIANQLGGGSNPLDFAMSGAGKANQWMGWM